MRQHRRFLDSSLVLVGIACPRLKRYSLTLLEKDLLAGSHAKPGSSPPGRLYSARAGCLRAPACSGKPPASHRVSLRSDFFSIPPGSTALSPGLLVPLDCSRSTCVGSSRARGRRLLCPPGELGGRRAGKSTWMGEGREGRKNNTSAVLVLQGPGWTRGLGQRPELFLHGLGVVNPNFL